MSASDGERPRVRLTFSSGGWVLLAAGVLSVLVAAFWLAPLFTRPRHRAVGDGRHVESYQFDTSTLLVPRQTLVASGLPKDGLPVLDHPRTITAAEADEITRKERGKFLVAGDVVVGVALGGEARAYPVRMLNWHEVVNDELGGRKIAVSYSPLGDAAVVFERTVGGEELTFGVSGLLSNSNTLVYDRRPGGTGESLWAPLQFRAVAGPAAGAVLVSAPCQLTRWDEWRERFPETTVLWPDPAFKTRYKSDPYSSYYGGDALRYPVDSLGADGVALKTPVVVLAAGAERRVLSVPAIAHRAGAAGVFRFEVGGREVALHIAGAPPRVFVEAEDGQPPPVVAHAFWFAWRSMNPQDRLGP
jgi:hypothetical protein